MTIRAAFLRGAAALGAATLLAVGPVSAAMADGTPSPAPAPGKVTFGIGPASAKDVDTRPDFTLLQGRGGTTTDHVALVNLSTIPLPVDVYVVDAVTGADGSVSLKARADKSTDVARWVKLQTPNGKSTVVVPARSKVIIPFTVTVPKDAPVGDHLAGIVASITADGAAAAGSQDVKLEQRVGVRLNLRVAGAVTPSLAIENLSASYAGTLNPFGKGSVVVSYTVHNTGNVKLGGRQQVSVAGVIGGATTATDLRDIPLLMPGASVDVTTVVPDVAPLVYLSTDVLVTAAAPGTDANPEVAPASASVHLWAVPWTLLALIILILLAALIIVSRRRRTPPRSGGRHSGGAPAWEPPSGPVLVPSDSGSSS
ncbi:MAG: DUF916 domain-containing protein [Actinobacteria bacterium]|nr:DUF916 domain-containing protein [Actinomycetota bacterium]